jgi:hypothetical protein
MIAHRNFAKNGRGDLVEDQTRDCAIIGSAAEDRMGLGLADTEDFIALVYYDQGPNSREPVLLWLADDHVSVDLGKVKWLTPQISQLGHVKINCSYSGAKPSLADACSGEALRRFGTYGLRRDDEHLVS